MTNKNFSDSFDNLIKAFCDGLKSYQGEVHSELVYQLIPSLKPAFLEALSKGHAFDVLRIAEQFCEAGLFRLNPEGVLSRLLNLFPHPKEMSLEEQGIFAMILDPIDQALPGTLKRLQWEWGNHG